MKEENLVQYSHIVSLDIKRMEVGTKFWRATQIAKKCPYTLLGFDLPTPTGVRLLVRLDSEASFTIPLANLFEAIMQI
jgi:hypothetical protein